MQRLNGSSKAMRCTFASNETSVIVGWETGELIEYSSTTLQPLALRKFTPHQGHVTCVIAAADNKILSSDKNGYVHLHHAQTMTAFRQENAPVNAVKFLNNGEEFMCGQNRGIVCVTNMQQETTRIVPVGHKESESVTAVLPLDDRLIASTSTDATVRVFDLVSNQPTHSYALSKWGYSLAAASSVPFELVAGSKDGVVRVFDLRMNSTSKYEFQAHRYGVTTMSSIIGRSSRMLLATGSSDRTCKIWRWDGTKFDLVDDLYFDEGVSQVCLSKDHMRAVVTSFDRSIRMYDLAYRERKLTQCLAEHCNLPRDLEDPICKYLF